jgi:hypothetical protein
VRAAVDLHLRGKPAVNQSWTSFRQDLSRNTRDNDDFPRVRLPIRLGDSRQLNDGLLGYWIETDDEYAQNEFYAPQIDRSNHRLLKANELGGAAVQLLQGVDDPPQRLSMLIDPRGAVHATSGILPVKIISLPPEQYAAALQAIEVTFVTAPILTSMATVDLPLAEEPGYAWSWLENDRGDWSEIFAAPTIERQRFQEQLAAQIWAQLRDPHVAWLLGRPDHPDSAAVAPAQHRAAANLSDPFAAWQSQILAILAELGVPEQPIARAAFLGRAADTIGAPAWDELLRVAVGWLAPVAGRAERAAITARDQRAVRVLAGALAGTDSLIESIFDLHQERIGPVSTRAAFAGRQELREGWLKLRTTG